MKLKTILAELNQEHKTHLSKEQFTLFIEDRLTNKEKEEVFKHLATCKRCRDILNTATKLKEEESLKPVNNINYKRVIKQLAIVASFVIVFLGVPLLDKQSKQEIIFKGAPIEKNIFIEAVEYWQKLVNKIFSKKNS